MQDGGHFMALDLAGLGSHHALLLTCHVSVALQPGRPTPSTQNTLHAGQHLCSFKGPIPQ
jgi:hypothetical protein